MTTLPTFPLTRAMPRLLGLVAALALAGCASLGSAVPDRPQTLPVPASLNQPGSTELAVAQRQPTAADEQRADDWSTLVQSAQLREVVQLALTHNRDLRAAVLAIDAARAQYRISESDQWPTGELSATSTRSGTASGVTRQYSVALGVTSWELDLWGRLGQLKSAALSQFLASEQTRRSVQQALVAETVQAWFNLAAQEQQLALAEQTLASRQRSQTMYEQRVALGADSALTLETARIATATARGDAASARTARQQARNALRVLLGTELPERLAPGTDGLSGDAVALRALPAELPASVLLARPDVRAAELQLQATEAEAAAAQAALLPTISLSASVGTAAASGGGLFQAGSGTWSLIPTIKWAALDGGASRAALDSAQVARSQQLVSYEQTVQTAYQETADALAVRADLAERLSAQQALVQAQQRTLELTQKRQAVGAESALSVLDAQRSLFSAQQTLISLRLTELGNRLTLFKVFGGA